MHLRLSLARSLPLPRSRWGVEICGLWLAVGQCHMPCMAMPWFGLVWPALACFGLVAFGCADADSRELQWLAAAKSRPQRKGCSILGSKSGREGLSCSKKERIERVSHTVHQTELSVPYSVLHGVLVVISEQRTTKVNTKHQTPKIWPKLEGGRYSRYTCTPYGIRNTPPCIR
jgi:hypothetical protein